MGIWIDTDMGFDDIAAILTIGHAGFSIDGVSLVFGNAPLDQVRRNAAAARQVFDWRFPMSIGRERSVMGQIETAQRILGPTGLPTLGRSLPACDPEPGGDAFHALAHWLETTAGPRRILALGPLTNIAALVLARPDLARRIDDLTWMGGSAGAGNHTASAEFNAYADPEAVAIVLAHGLPLRMVDLDFCRKKFSLHRKTRSACGRLAEATPNCWPTCLAASSRSRSVAAIRRWPSTIPRRRQPSSAPTW